VCWPFLVVVEMMLLFFYNKSSSSALNKSPPRFSEGRQRGPKATLSSLSLIRIQTFFATTSLAVENTKVFLRER